MQSKACLVPSGINKFMIIYVSNRYRGNDPAIPTLPSSINPCRQERVSCNPLKGDIHTYTTHLTELFYLTCIDKVITHF